jgi:hypothetical protein
MSIVRKWEVSFQWYGERIKQTQFTINEDGTFSDEDGGNGSWYYYRDSYFLIFDDATAAYTGGTNAQGQLSGTMTNNRGDYGTWSANEISPHAKKVTKELNAAGKEV